MRAILFLFLIICWTNAKDITCQNGTIEFNSLNDTFYMPDSSDVFPKKFICNYKINVQQGWYAYVWLSFGVTNPINGTALVVVTDSFGISEELYSGYNQNLFFLAKGGNIVLSTGMSNDTFFQFLVNWQKLPTTFTPDSFNIIKSDTEPKTVGPYYDTSSSDYIAPSLVTAETKVSVLIVPGAYGLSRGVLIYDGPDWNSKYLGTGMQLSKSKTQWVSTGKQMTVRYLYPANPGQSEQDRTTIIFQDYENTKNIVQYQGVDNHNYGNVTLDNSKGQSAMVTYTSDDQLDMVFSLVGNGTLDVYIGGITPSKKNLIASYQVDNSDMILPQGFRGNTRTYVLNGDNSKATIIFNTEDVIDMDNGKKGFISSNHYLQTAQNQYVKTILFTPEEKTAKFSFVIRCADMTPNTSFKVWVEDTETNTYNAQYTISNLPVLNQAITAMGTRLGVQFDSKNQSSNGLYIDFEVTKGSSNFFIFVSILITSLGVYLR